MPVLNKKKREKENITIVNLHTSNVGAPNFTKQILLHMKGQTGPGTRVRSLNTSLSSIHTASTHKKINKETSALNRTIDETDLRDI
jgi:hypothetical protein